MPNSVTSIGSGAFEGCTGLKSITIPNSVTSIGSYAFNNCTGLTSVTVGSGLKYIGNIFSGCNSITNLKVAGGVEKIESGIFDNTPWYANLPYGNVYIGSVYYKYKGTVPTNTNITIKKGTKGIADKAFENASGINTLTIPSSVTNIGKEVFAYKNYIGWRGVSIKTLIIEDLTAWCKIDFDGFYANPMKGAETITVNGKTLSTLTVPSGITEIKDYAFCNFNTIDEVVIPKSVKRIGTCAFYNCDSLSRVTVPGSVKTIGDGAFELCDELSYAALENGIESIGKKAFYETAIRYLIIPDSVKSIGSEAFTHCYKLTDLTVGNGITAIGANAFKESSKTVYTTKTAASFTKLSQGTTYKIRVTAYKTIDGKKVYSSVYTQLTTATKLGTPPLKVTAGSKKAMLSWNKQTGATGYSIFFGDNCINFSVLFVGYNTLKTHTPGKRHRYLIGKKPFIIITHRLPPSCETVHSTSESRIDDGHSHSFQTVFRNTDKSVYSTLCASPFPDEHSTMPCDRNPNKITFFVYGEFAQLGFCNYGIVLSILDFHHHESDDGSRTISQYSQEVLLQKQSSYIRSPCVVVQ